MTEKCPVCKNNIKINDRACSVCGFTDLHREFINKEDGELWIKNVVEPYKKKYEESLSKGQYNAEGYDRMGYDRNGYDKEGYDRSGYNKDGFYKLTGLNREGYDKDGYDKNGFDKEGYNRSGYDKDGFDRNGYNRNGYNRSGYDKNGFNASGYDKKGYNKDGVNSKGYNKQGYDEFGYNTKGVDRNGYDIFGFDKNGISALGVSRREFDKYGFHKLTGFDAFGFNRDGFDIDGYNPVGYNKNGFDKRGYDYCGFGKDGFNKEGVNRKGLDKDGYRKDGYNLSGYDRDGFDREGFNTEGKDRQGKKRKGWFKDKLKESFGIEDKKTVEKYVYATINNKLWGYGEKAYNGGIFDGEWLDEKPNGYGRFSKDNYMITGIFENGVLNGYGVITYSNGSIYEGEIRNNNANGYGKFVGSAGCKNLGYWKDGAESGRSITIYKSGDCYIGEHINGKKSGYGKYIWEDGREYIGMWENDEQKGFGIFTWYGGRYEGEWKNGKKHGKGKEYRKTVDEDFTFDFSDRNRQSNQKPLLNMTQGIYFAKDRLLKEIAKKRGQDFFVKRFDKNYDEKSAFVESNMKYTELMSFISKYPVFFGVSDLKITEEFTGDFVDGTRQGYGESIYKFGGYEFKMSGHWKNGIRNGDFGVYVTNIRIGRVDFERGIAGYFYETKIDDLISNFQK